MKLDITLEQAYEKASPRLRELMKHSVDVLREGEVLALRYSPENGYWLACPFGKDSQVLFHLAQLSGVKFKAFLLPRAGCRSTVNSDLQTSATRNKTAGRFFVRLQ